MGTKLNKLTALEVKTAKRGKHGDGGGLYLEVQRNGTRLWRMKYRQTDGSESRLSFGNADEVTLLEARKYRDEQRALQRDGKKDLGEIRRAAKVARRNKSEATFRNATAAWLAFKQQSWASETYRKALYIADTYLIPQLKQHSIATLTTKQAADVLDLIAVNAPSLASKARQYLNGIVHYAIRNGWREDGRLLSLRGALPSHEKGNLPAATDPKEITALLHAIESYPTPVMRCALKLTMLTAMRPGIVAAAEWSEINIDAGEWVVPASKMKMRHSHISPLSRQAQAVLREMQGYTGGKIYVFPPLARQQTLHLHRDAMSKALRTLGFQGRHSTHGFRGMFRTAARERLGVDSDVLEAQLAHAKKGDVQKAYDRTTFNDERRRIMQKWADYLDLLLAAGNNIVPFRSQQQAARSALNT